MRNIVLGAMLLAACAREATDGSRTPAARPYDTSCKVDSDCAAAPGCCPAPCTQHVINVKDMARARADLRCDPKEVCPSAGGCPTFEYLCVRGQCKLVFSSDEDFRQRESPAR